MKKIVIFIFLAVLCGNMAKANAVRIIDSINKDKVELYLGNKTKDYDFNLNKKQLGEFLELEEKDSVKLNNVYRTYDSFCNGMMLAREAGSEETRLSIIFNSIDYVLDGMKTSLDRKQYRKFLSALNNTLYNKGFDKERLMYCEETCK